MHLDVAIIGGGPGGSTCGAFLAKYRPGLEIGIFEREIFPRDHVGESQLPVIGAILDELGVWNRVEAAGFPIKVGGTYRWGNSDDLWDFHFLPNGEFTEEPRPAKFEGQRRETAFQVDRAIYDKLLLDFAAELGCQVWEGTKVTEVIRDADTVKGLKLENLSGAQERKGRPDPGAPTDLVTARYYIDASGHSGLLRRAMGVGVEEPSNLRNVAFWDYWTDARWAVTLGIGGTRIQVMSVGYGWLWFIPITETRTSVGFVCPADYYKQSGLKPEEVYLRAIEDEPRVRALLRDASRENKFTTTKDWSFVAEKMAGENWFLVGESAGFADPILSAGLSLTHASAREAAFSILEMDRGAGKKWLRTEYEERNRRRVLQHIRFADYWYTANAHFTDLKEYTREIARDAGLELDAEKAFQWLGTGGFIEEDIGVGGFGTVSFTALHQIANRLSRQPSKSAIDGFNGFVLNVHGAEKIQVAHYEAGRVLPIPAYRRNGKLLPLSNMVGWLVKGLEYSPKATQALAFLAHQFGAMGIPYNRALHEGAVQTLEAMVRDGWVEPKKYASGEPLSAAAPFESSFIQANHDPELSGS